MTHLPADAYGRPPLDHDGRLDDDVACLACGYNLRGLDPESRCPECGLAIGRSVHGNLLRYCDPAWVSKLATGMNLIVVSIVLSILLGCAAGVVLGPASEIIQLIPQLLMLAGVWQLTTPDPARLDIDDTLTLRSVARWSTALSTALTAGSTAIPNGPTSLTIAFLIVSVVTGIVSVLSLGLYAATLAERIPNLALARQMRICAWGYVVSIVFISVGAAIALLTSGSTTAAGLMVTPMIAGGIAMFAFGIFALILILRYRRAMSDAADYARRTWGGQPVTGAASS